MEKSKIEHGKIENVRLERGKGANERCHWGATRRPEAYVGDISGSVFDGRSIKQYTCSGA